MVSQFGISLLNINNICDTLFPPLLIHTSFTHTIFCALSMVKFSLLSLNFPSAFRVLGSGANQELRLIQ